MQTAEMVQLHQASNYESSPFAFLSTSSSAMRERVFVHQNNCLDQSIRPVSHLFLTG